MSIKWYSSSLSTVASDADPLEYLQVLAAPTADDFQLSKSSRFPRTGKKLVSEEQGFDGGGEGGGTTVAIKFNKALC